MARRTLAPGGGTALRALPEDIIWGRWWPQLRFTAAPTPTPIFDAAGATEGNLLHRELGPQWKEHLTKGLSEGNGRGGSRVPRDDEQCSNALDCGTLARRKR